MTNSERKNLLDQISELKATVERQRNELASLKHSNDIFETVVKSAQDIIVIVEQDFTISYLNPIAEKYALEHLGWTAEQTLHRPIVELLTPEQFTNFSALSRNMEHTRDIFQNGYERYLEICLERKKAELWFGVWLVPFKNQSGQVERIIAMGRDVTSIHQKNERLRILEQEQHRIQKLESVGLLAGGVAHDFNNILTVIMGNISMAERRMRNPDQARIRLTEANRAVVRARDLTSQLLSFAQGGAPLRTITSIEDIIKESAGFCLSGSSNKLSLSIPENLWSVEVDARQISQVIQNLVINADQAMPQGGEISVSAKNFSFTDEDILPLSRGRYVVVSVADKGTGIPENIIDRIFDPYFSTKVKGTGLGLATAHSIMRQHGGHIALTSKPGLGTTFHLYLPASQAKSSKGPSPPAKIPRGVGKILLMDDEEAIRDVAAEILQSVGYQVAVAAEGERAFELYKASLDEGHRFDLVILDLTVPGGLGGKETLTKIRAIDPRARIILSSGYLQYGAGEQYIKYGFDRVVNKPYDVTQLLTTLSEVLHLD